ncbi:MAG: HAMP domain-containing protein, partial [Chloroflexi bacterium]|nr:HAMP domain-containing protein [Chloroflexota bacterium]
MSTGIGAKIVFPYFLLTLTIAGVGAFIVVRLTTDSLQERYHNQLLDAGRIVSERMVDYEQERLEVLRVVAGTQGVATSLAAGDRAELAAWVPQIIANSNADAVELLDQQGREIYGWQRPPGQVGLKGEERAGADFSQLSEVRRVLEGYTDAFGEKRVLLSQTPYGLMIFTIGPVYQDNDLVGAVLIGSYIREMVVNLSESAIARVTLYTPQGQVVDTLLGGDQQGIAEILQEPPAQYQTVITQLHESPEKHAVVVAAAESEVPLRQVQVLGQEYTLAYGDWRVRDQSLGLFSVALPTHFIVSAAATSRTALSLLFSITTVAVCWLGFAIAQRIVQPLRRLVETSAAITEGDLAQRTGIQRDDEIGSLAQSFDLMTERLAERNEQLVNQASKLAAILDSIADGVIVLDLQGVIITANPVARRYLAGESGGLLADILRELPSLTLTSADKAEINQTLELTQHQKPHRYKWGKRVLSATIAPVRTPAGEALGIVIALRDITREAEAEELKDGFITGISHDLRTPLTAIKGYSDLLVLMANGHPDQNQTQFLQTINRNANTLLQHVNKMIDISEIQTGTLKLNKQNLNFSELAKTVAEKWRERIAAKGLSFQVELPEVELFVFGDPNRLSWALDNLLSNAHNYTIAGGVEVRLFQEYGQARLDVIDTGVGVDMADQPFLFTR